MLPLLRIFTLTGASLVITLMGVPGLGQADERLKNEFAAWSERGSRLHVAPVEDAVYRAACGGCHMAYQPGLMPAQSWERLLAEPDHFSTQVALSRQRLDYVRNYLLNNAAGRVPHRLPYRMMSSIQVDPAPLRISEIPYFLDVHRSLSPEAVRNHPEIGSFGNCAACHTQAEAGSYGKETRIPMGNLSRADR